MNRLRQALGDSADNPPYIETLARRGYRLLVPVEWVDVAAGFSPAPPAGGGAGLQPGRAGLSGGCAGFGEGKGAEARPRSGALPLKGAGRSQRRTAGIASN